MQVKDLTNQTSLLSTSVETLIQDAAKGHWLRREWKWVVTSFIALAALIAPIYRSHSAKDLGSTIDGRIEERVGKDLKTLQTDMGVVKKILEAISAAWSLREINALDPKAFPKALPILRKVAEQPVAEGRELSAGLRDSTRP